MNGLSGGSKLRFGLAIGLLMLLLTAIAESGTLIPADQVHQVTNRVLAYHAFNPQQSLFEKLYERWIYPLLKPVFHALGNFFERFINWLAMHGGFSPTPSVLSTIAVVVAIVLLAVVLSIVILIVFRNRQARLSAVESIGDNSRMEDLPPVLLLSTAKDAANKHDYALAFRLVYLAALVSLDKAGLVRFDRSRTNWEYVKEVRRAGCGFAPDLAGLTSNFDRKVYGGSTITVADYNASLATFESIATALENKS